MKVLYIASQTPESETLTIEREITELQRQFTGYGDRSPAFTFLPDLTLEELPMALSKYKPDVLHVSVHGLRSGLWFAREGLDGHPRDAVPLTGEALAAFLDPVHPPQLVVLNACESAAAAAALAAAGIPAIGTSAPITNQAAVASARLLYERLMAGRSIADAFRAVEALVLALEMGGVELVLCPAGDARLEEQVLWAPPRLAAKLHPKATIERGKPVRVAFGVVHCPSDVSQVCFFTDDPSFIVDDDTLEEDMSEIVRDVPRRGEIWTSDVWAPEGDHRVAACGMQATGDTFSVSGTLVEALTTYATMSNASPEYLCLMAGAVSTLRENDGAGLGTWERKVRIKKTGKAKRSKGFIPG